MKWLHPADGDLKQNGPLSQTIPHSIITEVNKEIKMCLQRDNVACISHLLLMRSSELGSTGVQSVSSCWVFKP